MRITARHWGLVLGVGLLLLVAHDVPSSHADEASRGTPWLGVYTQELTAELREGLDYSGGGVLVNRVVSDSPADRAGLKKGDVIVRMDSRGVDTPDELARIVRSSQTGESVSLQIVRDGERQTLTVRLEARPGTEVEPRERRGDEDPNEDENREAPKPFDKEIAPPHPMETDGDHDFTFEFPEDGMAMRQFMGRGRLGIRVESLNPELGDYFGVKDGRGALVLEVLKDTPAARAGLKAGDVITRVGERGVYDAEDLIGALRSSEGRVSLTVIRQGTRRTFEAELEQAPRAQIRRGDGTMGWGNLGPRMRVRSLDDLNSPDMRRELDELKKELLELRKELEEMRRN